MDDPLQAITVKAVVYNLMILDFVFLICDIHNSLPCRIWP